MPAEPGRKKHAWVYVVIIGAAFSIGLFFMGRYTARNGTPRPSEAATVTQKSIAVCRSKISVKKKGNAYFAEGVQDEILTRLAKVADLKVISRTSTQRFKSAPENLPEIAKKLGCSAHSGRQRSESSDRVRVNVS